MMSPALLFSRFLTAMALGVGLGFLYDFFTALPRRFIHIADGIFILALFACGIYFGFGICSGDLRPVYSFGFFIGASAWHYTVGKHLRAFFSRIFSYFFRLCSIFWYPFEKFFAFIPLFFKKTFALTRKWSTIEEKLSLARRRKGGSKNGTKKTPPDLLPLQPRLSPSEGSADRNPDRMHRFSFKPAFGHRFHRSPNHPSAQASRAIGKRES